MEVGVDEFMYTDDVVDDNKALKAHLLCNAGVLKLILKKPEEAMEYLHSSLEILDVNNLDNDGEIENPLMLNNTKPGRILAQMGAYHHITEQAVTSEGCIKIVNPV